MDDKLKVVVYLMLLRKNGKKETEILLQKRRNTPIFDQKYFFSAGGHVEKGESLEQALIREVREEIGIELLEGSLWVKAAYKVEEHESLVILYMAEQYFGTPENREPERCSELRWVKTTELPRETEPTMLKMLEIVDMDVDFRLE